ncbi:MAG: SRPBCC family protein [Actinomycetota bacterium]|nr:SRPBCC family protein [Actinomycetota bacterium]
MAHEQASIDIDRTPDEVWALVGRFGGLDEWMPGIESCRVEGDDRHLAMMGMEITEHLVSRDDAARSITYSITAGVPVEHHEATIAVTPAGGGSHVTWDVDVAPDDMAALMVGMYQSALETVKSHLGA